MRNTIFFLAILLFIMGCKSEQRQYPETPKVDTVDVYSGTKVPDPYRWLEDDRSEETGTWVKLQNQFTEAYLEQIPYRDKLKEQLTKMWDYARMSAPVKAGGKYFYRFNDGLLDQDVWMMLKELDGEAKLVIDPNLLSEEGTISLRNFSVSKDGKYVAYAISGGGSDWQEIMVRKLDDMTDLEDHLKWIKFSGISWYKDGFFYTRFPETDEDEQLTGVNRNARVYYHKVGTPQYEDILIYEDAEHPNRGFGLRVTEDKKYFLLSSYESTSGNSLYFSKASLAPDFKPLFEGFENNYGYIGDIQDKHLIYTDDGAEKYKILAVTFGDDPQITEFIPEDTEKVLNNGQVAGGKLIVNYLQDARSLISMFGPDGTFEKEIELPGIGTVSRISGEEEDELAFIEFESFIQPESVYKYDVTKDSLELYFQPEISFNSEEYITRQVFYKSKDGTTVPMFITHGKDLELNGKNPTMLYGYGGFNIPVLPSFRVYNTVWFRNDGIYAVANIRGGGEYGKDWHDAGRLMNKQNVFDDFIAAAEYLIREGYTNPGRLAVNGASNGGLLVGAVVNQRPDLFEVAFPDVGVMDMLRFHKFTIGRYWIYDYGSSDDSVQFEYILKYSPLHNIAEGEEYPAVMVTTADHDDRVVPAHSFKYGAALQEKVSPRNPVIIRIETEAGHGAGTPTRKLIDEWTDRWAFTFYNMGVEPEF